MSRIKKIMNAVNLGLSVKELIMLDEGRLSYVGDFIEAGYKKLIFDGEEIEINKIWKFYVDTIYEAVPKTITVNNADLVPPVTEVEEGGEYWLCNIIEPDSPIYTSEDIDSFIHLKMEKKFIFATKNDAVLYTNHVLLAAHKKLIESGEI